MFQFIQYFVSIMDQQVVTTAMFAEIILLLIR